MKIASAFQVRHFSGVRFFRSPTYGIVGLQSHGFLVREALADGSSRTIVRGDEEEVDGALCGADRVRLAWAAIAPGLPGNDRGEPRRCALYPWTPITTPRGAALHAGLV